MKINLFIIPETPGRYLYFVRWRVEDDYLVNDLIFYNCWDINYIHPKLKIVRFEKMGKCMKFWLYDED